MILYFSASGNSEAIAKRLGVLLDEKVVSILDEAPSRIVADGSSFGLVFPIYSWGVPPIVTEYVRHLNSEAVQALKKIPVWIVCTCGDDIGMAPEMLKKALEEKGLKLAGGWSVQMPNTYVLLPGFDVDSKELEEKKLLASESKIIEVAEKIANDIWEENYVRGALPRLKSGLLFPLFKKWGIFPDRWHYTDACVGCSMCAKICPVKNIEMRPTSHGPRPHWGKNCISCLACYHICPRNAVQYGKATRHKGQYHHP